jgi:hypothetical protein
VLEHGLSGFEARDLQNLGTGEAVCRVERSDYDFNLDVPLPDFPAEEDAATRRAEVIAASRAAYATPRADVEAALQRPAEPEKTPAVKPPKASASATPQVEPAPPLVSSPVLPSVNQPVAKPASIEEAPTTSATPVEAKPSAMVMAAGRGGMQHTTVQRRLKKEAEALGFRAVIEQSILDNAGSVDLALSRAEVSIACEITITTTVDHEVGNVAKCLKAGYPTVVAVGVETERLKRLENAVARSLGAEDAARVKYFLPDAFIAYLHELPPPAPPEPTVKQIRGYKVKRSYLELSPEERQARENQAIESMADLMRSVKNPPKLSTHEPPAKH